jgi:hypothetical protein
MVSGKVPQRDSFSILANPGPGCRTKEGCQADPAATAAGFSQEGSQIGKHDDFAGTNPILPERRQEGLRPLQFEPNLTCNFNTIWNQSAVRTECSTPRVAGRLRQFRVRVWKSLKSKGRVSVKLQSTSGSGRWGSRDFGPSTLKKTNKGRQTYVRTSPGVDHARYLR